MCDNDDAILSYSTAPPGQPRSLGLENFGATWVHICWEPPFDIDFPISHYKIIARSLDNVNAMVVNMSTTDNRTLLNVTNLDPGTTYNFSVVAVIEAGEVVARGVESESLGDIMTATTGVCLFDNVYIVMTVCLVWVGGGWQY